MNWSWPGSGSFTASFLNDNPEAAYRRYLGGVGGLGFGYDPRSKFYENQYGRQYQTYLSQVPDQGPNYSFTDYLQQHGGNLGQQFASLSPQQRGENPSAFAGRTRWVL